LGFAAGVDGGVHEQEVVEPFGERLGRSKPDKVLFDRAMDAMKHNRFDVARMTLQTLIKRIRIGVYRGAKLGVADSWYAEAGPRRCQQAEIEYKDFKTFFPNMPEAAEAQAEGGEHPL